MVVEVYSDGSSHSGGGKPGGWATVVLVDGVPVAAKYGGHPSTTNNLMELEAAIQGLRIVIAKGLHVNSKVYLVSDSQYALGMANGSMSPVKNADKCRVLNTLANMAKCQTRWVKGHSGNEFNERCDRLAKLGKTEATNEE